MEFSILDDDVASLGTSIFEFTGCFVNCGGFEIIVRRGDFRAWGTGRAGSSERTSYLKFGIHHSSLPEFGTWNSAIGITGRHSLHSARSATIGSTRVARRAGSRQATAATTASSAAIATKTSGSRGGV